MGGGRLSRSWIALAFAGLLVAEGKPGHAQTEVDLAAARKLFAEAVADEEESRYDAALEKFRRVEVVKDTPNVRYRVATCLEALGHRAEAVRSYEAVVRMGENDKTAADAVLASSERLGQLARIVPRLSIVLAPNAPPETQVRLDEIPLLPSDLREPIP